MGEAPQETLRFGGSLKGPGQCNLAPLPGHLRRGTTARRRADRARVDSAAPSKRTDHRGALQPLGALTAGAAAGRRRADFGAGSGARAKNNEYKTGTDSLTRHATLRNK